MLLYDKPRVVFGESMIDRVSCDRFISYGNSKFKKSETFHTDENTHVIDDWRTSSTFIDFDDHCIDLRKFTLDIAKKHFFNYSITLQNIELTQLQKYEVNQEYKYHCDYYNYNSHIVDNDRIGSLIFYLNEDFVGGETFFNLLNIKIKPKTGSALFFAYNYTNDINKLTEHSGEKVLSGTKYIATCWIRQFPFYGHG